MPQNVKGIACQKFIRTGYCLPSVKLATLANMAHAGDTVSCKHMDTCSNRSI